MGFAAAMTSSFAMTAKLFPNNVATVLVSADKSYASSMLFGHHENHKKTRTALLLQLFICPIYWQWHGKYILYTLQHVTQIEQNVQLYMQHFSCYAYANEIISFLIYPL